MSIATHRFEASSTDYTSICQTCHEDVHHESHVHIQEYRAQIADAYEAIANMKATEEMKTRRDAEILVIAQRHLREDLETRRSDSHDFKTHAVWSVKSALEEAYEAGHDANDRFLTFVLESAGFERAAMQRGFEETKGSVHSS